MSELLYDKKALIKAVSIGVFISLSVIIVLTCIFAAVMMLTPSIPYQAIDWVMLCISAAGAFTGSYIASAIMKSRGMVTGLLCGFLSFLCIFIAGLCAGFESVTYLSYIRAFSMLFTGMIAGILGVNKKEKIHIK